MGGPGVMGDPKIWGAPGNGEAKPIIKNVPQSSQRAWTRLTLVRAWRLSTSMVRGEF